MRTDVCWGGALLILWSQALDLTTLASSCAATLQADPDGKAATLDVELRPLQWRILLCYRSVPM
jgi:hypothetical protein